MQDIDAEIGLVGMSRNESDKVRERALGAVLSNAFLRWESVVTLIITLVLFFGVGPDRINLPVIGWQNWYWLVLGALAEVALVVTTLTDPNAAQQAVAREFEQQFDLREIKSTVSRQRLQSALEYRRNMMTLANRHQGAMRASLKQTIADIDDWIGHMHNLAQQIDAFDSNDLVERDRKMVPQQIKAAQKRLDLEKDPAVRQDLEDQLRQLQQQMMNLDATASSVKRAEIQLDSTLSSLGTVYAQMSLLGAKDVDSARAQRLREEIKDEVTNLQDTIDAMSEVQAQQLRLR
jgi:hypothetical protein